ncbi:MAG: flagellar hook-basal body complex protein [Candidatus Sericytochromatia bacterium]
MSGSGINGIRQALQASEQMIAIEASNLTRSQVPGSQEIRGTLTGNSVINLGNGLQAAGPGVSVSATNADFSQGPVQRTGFTTDMALNGPGFFVLMDAANNLFYTRRGDFHFDTDGHLVNKDGLYVASFDFKTGELERTSLKVNPVTDELGEQILGALEENGTLTDVDLATALGQTPAAINASLAQLKVAGYVTSYSQAGNTYFDSNLGEVGDQVTFTRDGFVVNDTRGLKRGNQLALAVFPNNQGLVPGRFGGEVYKATDAAVPGGIPSFGAPGDVELGLGSLETQALEGSTASVTSSTGVMGLLQRNFTSTAAAMKIFLAAWDDLNSVFR